MLNRREVLLSALAGTAGFGEAGAAATPDRRGFDHFLPITPAPDSTMTVVDCFDTPPDERLLLMSLQGLVNRTRPRIYLVINSAWMADSTHEPPDHRRDEFWLEWMIRERHTRETVRIAGNGAGIAELLAGFKSSYNGAVVPDPNLPISNNVAITVAGAERLIVCSKALAAQYGIPIVVDLRGKFTANHEAMRWAWNRYKDRLNPYLVATGHPRTHHALAWAFPVDYYVQHRAFVFWVTGSESVGHPGCDALKEKAIVEDVLAALPPNIPVLGFTWAGANEGLGEFEGVKMISEWGDVLIAAGIPNLSVHSGCRGARLKQRARRPLPKLDRTKTYVALTTSDGDALGTFYNFQVDWFRSAERRSLPSGIGIGIGPTAVDLIPALTHWYYEQADGSELFCDVSGIGYMYPEHFGTRRPDRAKVFHGFFRWTDHYLAKMDLQGLRPYSGDRAWFSLCARNMRHARYLIPDYGQQEPIEYAEAVYSTDAGTPVFRAITPLSVPNMEQEFVRRLSAMESLPPPLFLNAFVNVTRENWSFLYRIPSIIDKMGDRYVFVTPGELARLYVMAKAES